MDKKPFEQVFESTEQVDEILTGERAPSREAQDRFEAMLVEGLNGEEAALTREDWVTIASQARARVVACLKSK